MELLVMEGQVNPIALYDSLLYRVYSVHKGNLHTVNISGLVHTLLALLVVLFTHS